MTVTESHDSANLRHSGGKVVAYNETDQESNFNGYEAGTSIIKKYYSTTMVKKEMELKKQFIPNNLERLQPI